MAETAEVRETETSLTQLREHHLRHRPWGNASDVVVHLCTEGLILLGERNEARTSAESLLRSERINMGRHAEHGPLPWQLKTCTVCGGDGRDSDHHGVVITMDVDAIICKTHGEVGRDRTHGMCDTCKGKGKVLIEEAVEPAGQPV